MFGDSMLLHPETVANEQWHGLGMLFLSQIKLKLFPSFFNL